MGFPLKGTVHGLTVTLDVAVPSMEGMRVLVLLEPAEEPLISVAEAEAAWKHWLERGPQGPLEVPSSEDFP